MLETVKKYLDKLKEWWQKHTPKQKTAIISISAGSLLALTILITILVQPKYELLAAYDTVAETSEVMELLEQNEITYKTDDNRTLYVLKNQKLNAELVLGTNGYRFESAGIMEYIGGGLTTTEADKKRGEREYNTKRLERYLTEGFDFVKGAWVTLFVPEDTGTLIAVNQESYASVTLDVTDEMDTSKAQGIANYIAILLGNDSTKNIMIMDKQGNTWFSGTSDASVAGVISAQSDARAAAAMELENRAINYARGLGFVFATASANAAMDFNTKDEVQVKYKAPEGSDAGLLDSEEYYEETSSGGTEGIPGTDSNGETTYPYLNGSNSENSIVDYSKDWLQDTTTTSISSPAAGLIPSQSSIAVTMTKVTRVEQDEAKRTGKLDGISWKEYQDTFAQNSPVTIDEEYLLGFANATGIPLENITVIAREQFEFIDSAGMDIDFFDIVTIGLIIVILGLLAYVLYASFHTARSREEAEELPVESLLQSAPPELEDIELETKSEARKLVERFVEENPEAVANLLRNWLQEDWG